MGGNTRRAPIGLLLEYYDIFAFGPKEMSGINPSIMKHRLNVDPAHKPLVKKKRHMGPKRATVAIAEVQKPVEVVFIRECQYAEGIFNVVLIKKPSGSWRVCVDFTDPSKACPKDSYPLPKINKLVDAKAVTPY